ncbi:uncharacterized protein O3C94_005056 [Discoglossus pictus]
MTNMTPVAGSFLLGLVLCAVVTWAAGPEGTEVSKIKGKPGTCPKNVDFPVCSEDSMLPVAECKTDLNCTGKRKCCSSGCTARCLLPLEEKKDSCPYFNSLDCITVKPLPNQCHGDDQCPGTDRCCFFNCRNQCTRTVKVKPGQCPPKTMKCPKILEKPMCRKDGDCLGKKKCCDQCGMKCVDVKPDKVGSCPIPKTRCAFPPPEPKCQIDQDCLGAQKCCTPWCGKECTNPEMLVKKP